MPVSRNFVTLLRGIKEVIKANFSCSEFNGVVNCSS